MKSLRIAITIVLLLGSALLLAQRTNLRFVEPHVQQRSIKFAERPQGPAIAARPRAAGPPCVGDCLRFGP